MVEEESLAENTETLPEFKKPKKGRKRRKTFGSCGSTKPLVNGNQKVIQNCLPLSIRECTWLENTDKNQELLKEKNLGILEEREKKKLAVIQNQQVLENGQIQL
jgi:hypothetical protein